YEFSSASPFHMGFYYESGILYKAAPFIAHTYPELRLRQYLALARLAFKTGHPYWGWRFTGIGLHYVEDLTQPYHTILFPRMSTPRLLFVNAQDILGFGGPKARLIQIVNNRHLALENYLVMRLRADANGTGPIATALRDTAKDAELSPWSDT